MFLSEDEIVQDIQDNDRLSSLPVDADFYKKEACREIRNYYKLWDKSNPYTAWGVLLIDGVDHTINHPDMLSDKIFKRVVT